jgi:hypothetical protein
MDKNLKALADRIFSINASVSTTYGSALSVGSRETNMSSSTQIINELRTATAEFVKLRASGSNDTAAIQNAAKKVEGQILTLQVMGQISPELCDSLLDDLLTTVG